VFGLPGWKVNRVLPGHTRLAYRRLDYRFMIAPRTERPRVRQQTLSSSSYLVATWASILSITIALEPPRW